jgi:hypothetical protein
MPRPRPASVTAGRAAPFRVAPWQETTREGGEVGPHEPPPPFDDDEDDEDDPVGAAIALDDPLGVDYGDDRGADAADTRSYAGAGYISFLPTAGTLTGHLVDAESRAVVAVAGVEVPPPPTVDTCAAGGGDRLLALTLYEPGSVE